MEYRHHLHSASHGFMYLVAVMDWHTRYVLSWRLSNTLEGHFCIEALDESLSISKPEIFNTDQGSQFTAQSFHLAAGRRRDRDQHGWSRPRAGQRVHRTLWRTVKYEDVYLNDYEGAAELQAGLESYFDFYRHQRPHSSLGCRTPAEAYWN